MNRHLSQQRTHVDWKALAQAHVDTLTRIQLDLATMPRTHALDAVSERITDALSHHRKVTS